MYPKMYGVKNYCRCWGMNISSSALLRLLLLLRLLQPVQPLFSLSLSKSKKGEKSLKYKIVKKL